MIFLKIVSKLIFLVSFLIIGCTPNKAITYPVSIFENSLNVAFSKINDSIRVKRRSLGIEKDEVTKTVENCNDLIRYFKEGYVLTEGINNMQVASEYQVCFQLDYLNNAVAAKKSYLPDPYTNLIIEQLDLQTIRSSLKQKMDDKPQTIKDLSFLKPEKKSNTVTVDNSDWFYQFNILAKGDFNNDGNEDLLIDFFDQAKKGNYFSHSTYILTKNMSDKYLSVIKP